VTARYGLRISDRAKACLQTETPRALHESEGQFICSVRELCRAAADACQELGYMPVLLTDQPCCEAKDAGSFLSSILKTHATQGKKMAFLAGGETVVHLSGNGLGGRNQEMALSAAQGIAGLPNAAVICVGSDGTDGPTDAAGGYVDGESMDSLEEKNIPWKSMQADNDCYHILKKIDGLVITGPTGTNVNDVSVVLIDEN
jgi:hydroxypyruvate reductase